MTTSSRPVTTLEKIDVLAGLFASWDSIDALLAGLPDAAWQAPTALPGWEVRDVVAHILGTELMLLGTAAPEAGVDVTRLPHVRNDIGAVNERWIRSLRDEPAAALREQFRAVAGRRRAMLTKMVPEAWGALTQTPAGPDSYGRFMRVRIFDCWMHEQDIRDTVGLPSADEDLTGPDTRLALDEVEASLGFVVGKLGRPPSGSRVLIELTGPVARTIRIAVNGRAAVVDGFGGAEPTVSVRLEGLQFTRLCGGRPMTPARPQTVDLDGDTEAGRRIVDNLAFVI